MASVKLSVVDRSLFCIFQYSRIRNNFQKTMVKDLHEMTTGEFGQLFPIIIAD
jgi:hypothetical protein